MYYSIISLKVKDGDSHVLMSMVSGDAVEKMKSMTEEEVVDKCLEVLRKIFPDKVGWHSLFLHISWLARKRERTPAHLLVPFCLSNVH